MSMSWLVAQAVVNGLVVGMLYLLMAIGFTLAFGVMRIVNFAHGQFYMVGAVTAYVCCARFSIPFTAAIAIAAVVALVLGAVVERGVLHSFRSDQLNGMIATIGVGMVVENAALWVFGPNPLSLDSGVSGILRVGPFFLPAARVFAIALSAAVLVVFLWFMQRTRTGRAIRAVVQDREMAKVCGIRAQLIYPLGFALGVVLAATAGAIMAPLFSVSPFMGSTPLLKAFIVVILGGLGSIPGAALASLLLGVIESVTSTFVSASVADMLQFALVIVIMLVRPGGLLGIAEA
jgi:branched-chain amino acid transport system permease protein